MTDTFFHLTFVAVFVVFFAVRGFYRQKVARSGGKAEYREGKSHMILRLAFGLPFIGLVFGYMLLPRLQAWAEVPLPLWARWSGVVLCVFAIPLIWWVHRALDENFSLRLHVRDEHTLVTHGPYRWVRHPMYTVLYIFSIALFLLTGNWLIGGMFLGSLTLIVVTRLANEEAVMLETFGDEYHNYMKRSGRFLPRIV